MSKHPAQPSTPAPSEASTQDRTYIGLARRLHEMISTGRFAPGARLPSERSLAEQFGVSRTQVREAVVALEVQGLVEVRVGSGIYVSTPDPSRSLAFELPHGPGPIETLRARALVESEVAALAALERKDEDLDVLFATLRAMREQIGDKAAFDASDRAFHLRMAESAGNSVLQHVVAAMWDGARSDPLWIRIEEHFHTSAMRAASLEDHQRVFAAIMARDPAAARAAMRAHLDRVIEEFSQAWR